MNQTKKTYNGNGCPICKEYGQEPNETSLRAIAESRSGKGLIRYDSIEELFADLNKDDDE